MDEPSYEYAPLSASFLNDFYTDIVTKDVSNKPVVRRIMLTTTPWLERSHDTSPYNRNKKVLNLPIMALARNRMKRLLLQKITVYQGDNEQKVGFVI